MYASVFRVMMMLCVACGAAKRIVVGWAGDVVLCIVGVREIV